MLQGGGLAETSHLMLGVASSDQNSLLRAWAHLNRRKPLAALLVAIALLLAAASLAWALFWAQARLPHNTFQTGTVSIDLNGGKPVFGSSIEMEPGRTLVEDFTVTNTGTASCYYRVRLEGLKGELASALTIAVKRGDEVLYQGSAIELERTTAVCDHALEPNQTDTLTAVVTMDEASGNNYQGKAVTFDIVADATQVRNNEGREFE